MVTAYYIGGPSNNTTMKAESITCEWPSMCEHMTGDETEGLFVVSKPIKDSSGWKGYIYQHVECEYCARRKGLIW